MIIQSSVRSGRNLLHLLQEDTRNVVTFTVGKMKPYIKVQSTGLGLWKDDNFDENSRRGCETRELTWNSNHWKIEICDFLYLSQFVSYILDIFPLQTGMCFLVRSFHRLTFSNGNRFLRHFLLEC